jgi:hypothetical protein
LTIGAIAISFIVMQGWLRLRQYRQPVNAIG